MGEYIHNKAVIKFLKGQLMDGWGEGGFDPDADLQIVFVSTPDVSPEEEEDEDEEEDT